MNNESVTIGGYHVYSEWGLVMTSAEIKPPEANTVTIDVPGRDGVLDITDNLFGRTPYSNREINMHFEAPDEDTWAVKYSSILGRIHGKTLNIIFDSDPTYFYTGRCSVGSFTRSKRVIEFDIQVIADPYKYDVEHPDSGIL